MLVSMEHGTCANLTTAAASAYGALFQGRGVNIRPAVEPDILCCQYHDSTAAITKLSAACFGPPAAQRPADQ